MWKKILYFGIAIIFGIFIYIIGYSSNQMNHLESIVSSAIAEEKFYKVPMVWGGCFDTKSIVEDNTDKLDLQIYPATSQTDITFGSDDNTERYLEFEYAYYLYIFNAKFTTSTAVVGETKSNKTSIHFVSNETSKSYDYYFVVDDAINSSSYIETPTTKEEYLLNSSRDVTNTKDTWNFMRITFTKTMLDEIEKQIGGKITNLSINDCDGNSVYNTDIKLDYSQDFFSDKKMDEMFIKYNTYLDAYIAADGDNNKLKELNEEWGTQFETWKKEFIEETETTGYAIGYESSIVSPSKLVWQTVGMLALYALVIALFYILLFHFSFIKSLFSKESYKDYSRGRRGKVSEKNTKQPRSDSSKTIVDVTPDVKPDDNLETVGALDVIEVVKDGKIEETAVVEEVKVEETPVVGEVQVEEKVEEKPTIKKTTTKKAPAKKAVAPKSEEIKVVESTPVEEVKIEEKKPATKRTTKKIATPKADEKVEEKLTTKKTTTKKTPAKKAVVPKVEEPKVVEAASVEEVQAEEKVEETSVVEE